MDFACEVAYQLSTFQLVKYNILHNLNCHWIIYIIFYYKKVCFNEVIIMKLLIFVWKTLGKYNIDRYWTAIII